MLHYKQTAENYSPYFVIHWIFKSLMASANSMDEFSLSPSLSFSLPPFFDLLGAGMRWYTTETMSCVNTKYKAILLNSDLYKKTFTTLSQHPRLQPLP